MHGARRLVVTTLLAVVAITVVAGGASGAPPSGDWTAGPAGHTTAILGSDGDRSTGPHLPSARDDVNATVAQQEADGNMTVIAAPGSALEPMLAATSADDYGSEVVLSARPRVTTSDTLVLRIQTPGLEEALRAQPGGSTTERFVSLIEGPDADLLVSQFGARDGLPRAMDTTNTSALGVVPAGNNTYDVVVDLSTVRATLDENGNDRADDEETVGVTSGDTYRANFTFGDAQLQRAFGVFPVAVIFLPNQPGNNPILRPAPNQTIHAETTLAPGTQLGVEVTVNSEDAFRRRQVVTVTNRSQSQFEASFDLREAPDGVDISVVVDNNDQLIASTAGRIPALRASISLPERADQRDRMPVSSVSFSQGGFLIVRDGGPDGPIVANRYLTGGNYTDLGVLLARAAETDTLVVTAYADLDTDRVFDANGPDRPYRTGGTPIRAQIQLPSVTPTPTPTPTPGQTATRTTATPTPTATSTPTARRVTTPPTLTTTDPQTTRPFGDTTTEGFTPYTITATGAPGFGIGVALAAIVALVILLAGRQQRG